MLLTEMTARLAAGASRILVDPGSSGIDVARFVDVDEKRATRWADADSSATSAPPGTAAGPDAGDLVVVVSGLTDAELPHVRRRLGAVPDGSTALLVVAGPAVTVPVGMVLELILGGEGDGPRFALLEVLPVSYGDLGCAVVLRRTDQLVPPAPYLSISIEDSTPVTAWAPVRLDDPASVAVARRALAEGVLEGFVARAREVEQLGESAELAETRQRLAEARAEAAAARDRVRLLESSEALAIGRAVTLGARHPVKGAATLARQVARTVRSRRSRPAARGR